MSIRKSSAALVVREGDPPRTAIDGWHEIDRPVRWGSVSKVWTAGLVHVAVDAGKLDLDTTVAEVLGGSAPETVTVRTLVEHTSGLLRVLRAQNRQLVDPYRAWTRERFDDEVVPHLADEMHDEVPRDPEYSNLGYAVLTRVLETVLGRPWLELLVAELLDPAGLDPTGFGEAAAKGDGAVDALSIFGRRLADWDVGAGPFVGAGGLVAPLPSVATAIAALADGGPLDPREQPHAWRVYDGFASHQGALMRSGSIAVFRPGDGRPSSVGVAHAVGGMPGMNDGAARRALENLVDEVAVDAREER